MKILLAATLIVASYTPSVLAQSSQPRLAAFNVIATDAKDQPVTDLHPEDLKIEDNGIPQPIAFFRSTGGIQPALSGPSGPGEYSNSTAPVLNTTVILFDLLNEDLSGRGSGAKELIAALENAPSPERIALILMTRDGKLYPVHDLGSPMTGAAATLPASGPASKPWTSNVRQLFDKAMNEAVDRTPTVVIGRGANGRPAAWRSAASYQLLGDLAPRLSAIPGRKTLVWITDGGQVGLPLSGDITWQRQRVAALMSASDVAVYTVRQSGSGAASWVGTHLGLEEIPELTGGRIYPSGSVQQALTDSAVDARSAWRVGFFPSAGFWNDKFHKIRATTSRPGIRIRAPQEFAALAKDTNIASDSSLLPAAGTVPFDIKDIGLRARVSSGASEGAVHLQISVNSGDLPFEMAGDKFVSQLSLAFLKYDKDLAAQPKSITTQSTLKVSLTREQMDQAAQKLIGFPQDVTIDSSIHTLRLVIYNRASGEYGTLTVPVNPQ